YPKPGNVHRLRDFSDTRFEHYLASSIAVGPSLREAAMRGVAIRHNRLRVQRAGLGSLVLACVKEAKTWHTGGNTVLGSSLLLCPLSIGAGYCGSSHGKIFPKTLRASTRQIIEKTTVNDAIQIYQAIRFAAGGSLSKSIDARLPGVLDPTASQRMTIEGITLHQVMANCAWVDGICLEWTNGFYRIFEVGLLALLSAFTQTSDINLSVGQCYLRLLSNYPDTLIAKKSGINIAENVCAKAKIAWAKGGYLRRDGRTAISKLDRSLAKRNLNPGTTADLTVASVMVSILGGLRP
ncbi:MAG: triphosphoribosyl-dephospho-CoA synthase, partial [Candidatus Bathyarchaeia archaeon]